MATDTKKPTMVVVASDGAPAAVAKAPMLRQKDLVAEVARKTGVKKAQVKDIVAATLATLGAALSRGEGLNLPPLGRAHVNRSKESGASEILMIKLRRGGRAVTTDGAGDAGSAAGTPSGRVRKAGPGKGADSKSVGQKARAGKAGADKAGGSKVRSGQTATGRPDADVGAPADAGAVKDAQTPPSPAAEPLAATQD